MKTFGCSAAIWLMLSLVYAGPVPAQTRMAEGLTVVEGPAGPQICLGRWVPSGDVALPGVCQGQMVDISQLAALSSQMSSEKLDQLLRDVLSIDQKLAVSNDQVRRLIEVTEESRDVLSRQAGESLRSTISRRFDALPREVLADNAVREELAKLKENILKDIERHYAPQPSQR